MSSVGVTKDIRWWEHPDRTCKGDYRYGDLSLIVAPTSKARHHGALSKEAQIDKLKQGCFICPVYYDCLEEMLQFPKRSHYGVRAGLKGKS